MTELSPTSQYYYLVSDNSEDFLPSVKRSYDTHYSSFEEAMEDATERLSDLPDWYSVTIDRFRLDLSVAGVIRLLDHQGFMLDTTNVFNAPGTNNDYDE